FFELSDVLTQLLKAYSLTEAELSRKVNLPRAIINRLVNGKTPDPKASTLDAIANYFNISVDQLLGKQPVNFNHKVSQSSSSILRIPIIDWSETRLWSKIISNLKPENHKEWVTTDICNGTNLFCVKVNSDSMWPN
ncbi:helix-turn-helix domain-containing protein, partial [Legionella gresilensis]|uniref:helix-turn-helix domain-containing protein n=1 Tax=Legionella gresilensis TaxID=91823 RepID=UPI001A952693